MGERKVLNKYIPPDFDPALVPRGEKLSAKDGTVDVRMMLPFTLQCDNCHTFLYRGRKFNSKKEPMGGSDGKYLGITRWRFYIKCTHCSRPVTFLTDPKNADYEMESGGTRNYEIQRDKADTEAKQMEFTEQEKALNPMKALENRVVESQKEMADLDNLEQIRAMNARHVKLWNTSTDELLGKRKNETIVGNNNDDDQFTAEDEALVQSIQFGASCSKQRRRLNADDERKLDLQRQQRIAEWQERQTVAVPSSTKHPSNVVVMSKRRRQENQQQQQKPIPPAAPSPKGLSALLGGYSSSSSDGSSAE
jgi:Saf4/Yju2 protein